MLWCCCPSEESSLSDPPPSESGSSISESSVSEISIVEGCNHCNDLIAPQRYRLTHDGWGGGGACTPANDDCVAYTSAIVQLVTFPGGCQWRFDKRLNLHTGVRDSSVDMWALDIGLGASTIQASMSWVSVNSICSAESGWASAIYSLDLNLFDGDCLSPIVIPWSSLITQVNGFGQVGPCETPHNNGSTTRPAGFPSVITATPVP